MDALTNHYFPNEECTGEFSAYYYSLLAISHTYFLLEFSLRAFTVKEVALFLQESDSIVEMLTTIPFFVLWFIVGTGNYYFQLFVALDTMRLFLYDRYIKNIKTELTYGIVGIVIFMICAVFMGSVMI
jgi:hypothetical protein